MEEFLNKRKSRLVAVSLLIILSVVVIFAGSRLYSQYREQVIRTEYALGITLPQCQQELHRELRMRHRKDPSPEPSTEDGERKRQGQTDSLTGLPHLVEGMPAEKQKTFRELVGEILELCNP